MIRVCSDRITISRKLPEDTEYHAIYLSEMVVSRVSRFSLFPIQSLPVIRTSGFFEAQNCLQQ